MCDTPFKTPYAYETPKSERNNTEFYTPLTGPRQPQSSDSEESVSAASEHAGSGATMSSNCALSIVAEFDDLLRLVHRLRNEDVEKSYQDFTEQVKIMFYHFQRTVEECQHLQEKLEIKCIENSDLLNKLSLARMLIDKEKKHVDLIEKERFKLEMQMLEARHALKRDENKLSSEAKEKLSLLESVNGYETNDYNGNGGHLSAIPEINSTGSLLSDFSYSRSEDDLDVSLLKGGKQWKKHRPSTGGASEPAYKKRRSSGNKVVEICNADTVKATTTLTVSKDGPITATSIIESVPKNKPTPSAPIESQSSEVYTAPSAPPASLVFQSWKRESPFKYERTNNHNGRLHNLQAKTMVMPDTCVPCEKKIRFGKSALRCKECRTICHVECKDKLPLPCIPVVNTPNNRNILGVIGDYTPTLPPMVPALIIHCVNEIELRGLNELGIYRVPGSERDVKALKEKFLKGKGTPYINQVDVHVLCGTVKDFLRTLHEPLITYGLWRDFVQACDLKDKQDIEPALQQTIACLPQPNRDTLAYMILHLQRVAEAKPCKMPISNLAKIFAPTIVGYSSENPERNNLLTETQLQTQVMELLLLLPTSYWESFVNVDCNVGHGKQLQQTPSTDSLLRPTTKLFLTTPNRGTPKRKRFFPTPPM